MSGELIVVTGPPGSGKTTVAGLLVREFASSALVPGDDFFGFLRSGYVDPWLREAHTQNTVVTRAAAAAAGRLTEHCDVVYDGVVGPWFLDTFLEFTGLDRLHYAVLMPPLDVCLERVRVRTGHGFTDLDAAEHMWEQFANAEVDNRFRIADGTGHPADRAADVLGRVRVGSARYPG